MNGINLHEQGLSRRYLNLGDDDRVHRYLERGRFEEIPLEEALNRASPLSTALRVAGWHELRVHIQLGEVAIH